MNNCYVCGKEILVTERKRILAFDVPYINIELHQACFPTEKWQILKIQQELLAKGKDISVSKGIARKRV